VGVGPTVDRLLKDNRGKVRLVVKMYPYRYRDFSHIAAEAVLAARDQGKFWEMHQLLLKKSPQLNRQSLIGYAQEIGLDVKRFTESIDTKKNAKAIERDIQLAVSLDLYETPAFFINGRKVTGNRPYPYFKKVIDEELKNVRQ
jgi:protein-disulfide isomerase